MKLFLILFLTASSLFCFAEEKTGSASEVSNAKESASTESKELPSIDREAVKRVVRNNISLFKACYDTEYKKDPTLKGKVTVGFDISDTGDVIKADIKKTDIKNEALNSCLIDRMRSLKFPKAPAGTVAEVHYPFTFKGN